MKISGVGAEEGLAQWHKVAACMECKDQRRPGWLGRVGVSVGCYV